MNTSEDLIMVDVRVSKPLKEYLLACNSGNDIIVPGKYSQLWSLIKTQLDLVPTDYKPINPYNREDYIRICLLKLRRTKSFNVNTLRTTELNTLFRNHLSEEGQRTVAAYLTEGMKVRFRSYISGALSNNPSLTIHDAIYEFCDDYGIVMEKITYEMLRKDWYRFRKRSGQSSIIPIESHNL